MAKSTDDAAVIAEAKAAQDVEVETPVEPEATEAPVEPTSEQTEEIAESPQGDAPFKPRFTQFQGETQEEYIKKLEDGYYNSSQEGVRLNQELQGLKTSVDGILSKVATNPNYADELANDLAPQPQSGITDPAQAWAASRMQEEMNREYQEFTEEHPELVTDPALADRVREELSTFAEVTWQKQHRLLGMKEGLKKAWTSLGLDNKTAEIGAVAKETAGQVKTSSTKKSTAPVTITESQLAVGKRMFPNKSDDEIVKILSEYKQ